MSTHLLVQGVNEIGKHRNILNVWKIFGESNSFYQEAKKVLYDSLNMKLIDLESHETIYEFNTKMNSIYIKYFDKQCAMTPQEVIADWVTRAMSCPRIKSIRKYGYEIFYNPNTQKDKLNVNFLFDRYDVEYLVSESDLNKLCLTNLEKLAKEIVGCTIIVNETAKPYNKPYCEIGEERLHEYMSRHYKC